MLGIFVHMCTKYDISMSNPVPEEVCTENDDANANAGRRQRRRRTKHD